METAGKGAFIPFTLLCINLYAFSLCWEKLHPKGQEEPAQDAPVDEARSLPKAVKILQWIVTIMVVFNAFMFWFWPSDKRTMSSMYFFYDDYVRNKNAQASMLDQILFYIGNRTIAGAMLGFLGLMKNGKDLRFSACFWFVMAFNAIRDAVCSILYEQEDKMKWGGFAIMLIMLGLHVFCLMQVMKKCKATAAQDNQGAPAQPVGTGSGMGYAPQQQNSPQKLAAFE